MATDGTGNPDPQTPDQMNNTRLTEPLGEPRPDAHSRRAFLRKAVIGSAATAVVVGGGAAVATSPLGPKLFGSVTPAFASGSHPDPYGMCFEESQLPGSPLGCIQVYTNNGGHTVVNPGSFWITFAAVNLTPGATYTVEIDESTTGGAPWTTIDDGTSAPFTSQEGNIYTATGTNFLTCPIGSPMTSNPTDPASAHSFVNPVNVTLGSSDTALLVLIHLTWNGGVPSGSETITFRTLLNSSQVATTSVVAQNDAC
jgi:hypothetical protein